MKFVTFLHNTGGHNKREQAGALVDGGCGLELERILKPGDVVELEAQGIGVLRNRLVKLH